MARHPEKESSGRVKFRVIEFELDGGNAAIQDALKSLGTALAAGRPHAIKQLIPQGAAAAPTDPGIQSGPAPGPEPDDDDSTEEPVQAPRQRGGPAKPRAVRRPTVIDVDLTNGEPLKDYLDAHVSGSGDSERYLAIANWFKNCRKIDQIGADHVYTAYRAMGWNVPADPLMPFRNMKHQGWFNKGKKRGEYAINHVGEGKVGTKA